MSVLEKENPLNRLRGKPSDADSNAGRYKSPPLANDHMKGAVRYDNMMSAS